MLLEKNDFNTNFSDLIHTEEHQGENKIKKFKAHLKH